jgi:UDP-N-acetylglucosamine acyltransferase
MDGVRVDMGAIVEARTTIGKQSRIFPYASVGSKPQDLKYKGEDTELIIGERNSIREYANISIGTVTGCGKTVLGNDNLVMLYSSIAHDCIIGNNCVFANATQLAGHVEFGSRITCGAFSGFHQFTKIGDLVMVAAGSLVTQDVPPYCLVNGNRASMSGLNSIGLQRANVQNADVVKQMFKLLYKKNLTQEDALSEIEKTLPDCEERRNFVDFVRHSERGICR